VSAPDVRVIWVAELQNLTTGIEPVKTQGTRNAAEIPAASLQMAFCIYTLELSGLPTCAVPVVPTLPAMPLCSHHTDHKLTLPLEGG
jgi:hypothetical protein